MGKGYNNYMCKKPFHPGSKANIKRAWMAEQKTENEKKKQEELKVQYEKEQDLYKNKALISSESKDKLELNFMYEAPPGAKRERLKEDDEPEYKFEWQRKYNAPREDYAKGNADIKDQPFGIPVRNVKCIKCHKWGHINTDKECPLYSQASTSSMPTTSMDPMELMKQMREDGFGLKENVLGHRLNPKAANQQLIPSEDESDPEAEFLKSLSTADKKKLLRKLKKLSKKQEKKAKSKKKKSKKSKKKTKKYSSDSDSDSKPKHKKRKKESSSSRSKSSSSDSESENDATSRQNPSKTKDVHSLSKDSRIKNSKSAAYKSDITRNPHSKEARTYEREEREVPKDKSKCHELTKDSRYKEDSFNVHHNIKSDSKRDCAKSKSSHHSGDEPQNKKLDTEKVSKKHKATYSSMEENVKRIKTEKIDPSDIRGENSENPSHPDGFRHICPQAVIAANYEQSTVEYTGGQHDRFRDLHRDDRSPSVKQKYNK